MGRFLIFGSGDDCKINLTCLGFGAGERDNYLYGTKLVTFCCLGDMHRGDCCIWLLSDSFYGISTEQNPFCKLFSVYSLEIMILYGLLFLNIFVSTWLISSVNSSSLNDYSDLSSGNTSSKNLSFFFVICRVLTLGWAYTGYNSTSLYLSGLSLRLALVI